MPRNPPPLLLDMASNSAIAPQVYVYGKACLQMMENYVHSNQDSGVTVHESGTTAVSWVSRAGGEGVLAGGTRVGGIKARCNGCKRKWMRVKR